MLKLTHVATIKDNRVFNNPAEIKSTETFHLIPTEAELEQAIIKHGGNMATVEMVYEIM